MSSIPVALSSALAVLALALPAAARAADTAPPVISHQAVREAPRGQALTISATITDDSDIFEPTLYYRAVGAKKFLSVTMEHTAGASYSGAIPAAAMKVDVEYFIEAYDSLGNGPTRFASDAGPQKIKASDKAAAVAASLPPPEAPEPAKAKGESASAHPATEKPATEPAKVKVEKAPAPAAAVEKPASGNSMATLGYTAAGVGAAALLAGGAFAYLSSKNYSEAVADPVALSAYQKEQAANSDRLLSGVSFAAGGVLMAGGLVLALLPGNKAATPADSKSPAAPGTKEKEKERDVFDSQLFIGPTGAGFTLTFY